jgi:hypothetical protein
MHLPTTPPPAAVRNSSNLAALRASGGPGEPRWRHSEPGRYTREYVRQQYQLAAAAKLRAKAPGPPAGGGADAGGGTGGGACTEAPGKRAPETSPAPVTAMLPLLPHAHWLRADVTKVDVSPLRTARDGAARGGAEAAPAPAGGFLPNRPLGEHLQGLSQTGHWHFASKDVTLGLPKDKGGSLYVQGGGGHGVAYHGDPERGFGDWEMLLHHREFDAPTQDGPVTLPNGKIVDEDGSIVVSLHPSPLPCPLLPSLPPSLTHSLSPSLPSSLPPSLFFVSSLSPPPYLSCLPPSPSCRNMHK